MHRAKSILPRTRAFVALPPIYAGSVLARADALWKILSGRTNIWQPDWAHCVFYTRRVIAFLNGDYRRRVPRTRHTALHRLCGVFVARGHLADTYRNPADYRQHHTLPAVAPVANRRTPVGTKTILQEKDTYS